MFRGVFGKIIVTYLSILLVGMVGLSLAITALTDRWVYTQKVRTLESIAAQACRAANEYEDETLTQAELTRVLDAMGYISDTKIYIVRAWADHLPTLSDDLNEAYLREALTRTLGGETVLVRQQYAVNFDARMIFMAAPWRRGEDIAGAVLLYSPEEKVSAIVSRITWALLLTAAALALAGGFVLWLFTRRIVAPLRDVEAAADRLTRGELVADVPVTSRDEIGSLARSFNAMKEKLAQNEALRQDLIANISHDLRTPLTTLYGYINGMAEGLVQPEDYPRTLDTLRQQTRRLMNLTGGILEAAQVQAGRIELNRRSFALEPVLRAAVAANAELAGERGMEIAISAEPDLALTADPAKVEQILYNLVNNAVKYAGPGGHVAVSARREGGDILLTVADDGPGIAEADLPHIFDRYYRAPQARGRSGYGLGLGIVKAYTEAHGGAAQMESAPGQGARVTVRLPG